MNPETEKTEQNLQNLTYDQEFDVFAYEMKGFDGTEPKRVAVTSTGLLKVTI
jgi:hypothetical protein